MNRLNIILFLLCLNQACVRQQFAEPANTNGIDQGYLEYKSIAELRSAMGVAGSKEIKENILISGVVIADDRTGNFYKQIIIDDGTAAIPVLLDAYNLYSDFPVGRKIYVKCKGLYTNYYYKLPQLGFAPDERGVTAQIPYHLWSRFIIKADIGNRIRPVELSLAEAMKAKPELYNRLVTISEAQIMDTAAATRYALPATLSSATNIALMDCDSNTISLRTSGYSVFQSSVPPRGKGKLTVVYTVYNNTPQLVLRDTADVEMVYARCF